MSPRTLESAATFAGQRMDTQFIGGRWRQGRSAKVNTDTNPFEGSVVAEIASSASEPGSIHAALPGQHYPSAACHRPPYTEDTL